MKEALALACGGRRLSAREEELLGLLACFPDGGDDSSDRELSFSDLIEAGAGRPPSADDLGAPAAPREDHRPAAAAAPSSSPGRNDTAAAAAKRQQAATARQRARRSAGSRGSCGGGGDGVLLNFYVPGLLTRSMTTPRPSRGPPSAGALQGAAPAKPVAVTVAGKASRMQTALGIGCWPALWGRSRRPAKACS